MAHPTAPDIVLELLPLAAAEGRPDWLDEGERARLDGMGSALRRRQFLAGHGLARRLAARLSGRPVEGWRWDVGADQRRRLLHAGGDELFVSVSHSGDFVATAVARRPLGLDLECEPRERPWRELAGRLFSPPVAAGVGDDPAAFRRTWALAEAEAKRSGAGIQRAWLRRLLIEAENGPEAEAWSWPLAEQGALALAAWPGALVTGGPQAPSGWRYRQAD